MTQDDSARRAAGYRLGDDPAAEPEHESEHASGRDRRLEAQPLWVDQQIRAAMRRGDFDDLPYAGKPLPREVFTADPDWWVKRLVEREQISGVLPPALQLRKDDAELDPFLDTLSAERRVREELEAFNRRVVEARRQLLGGPPVVTVPRDVEAEVLAWRERREARRRAARDRVDDGEPEPRPRRWLRRRR